MNGLHGEMPRPIRVAMIGAGSFFTNSILKDILLIPGSKGGELRLVDIDDARLNLAHALMLKIADEAGVADQWKITKTTDRKEALPDCDYVINTIEVAGLECVRSDNDIPLEFGVSQNIGDTIGPGGLFKAMRTIPAWLSILEDCEELCPQAQVLNYTNPMNAMCLAALRYSSMSVVGLCHSVQGTSRMLARFAEVEYEQMKWECAGINHLAWFTTLEGPDGQSLYPKLMSMANDRSSEFAIAEPVRSDMMRHFGAFITESSGHLSEYLPYYRKRRDLLDAYTDTGYRGQESFYANNWPTWRENQDKDREAMIAGEKPISLERSLEYGAWIIEAMEKNVPFVIHGNVANEGAIDNLPADGCVEVACLVDRNGIQPTKYGRLPSQMAAICASNMAMFDLVADACIERSFATAKLALMLDPLTSAVCCPEEISRMFDQMVEIQREFLPGFD